MIFHQRNQHPKPPAIDKLSQGAAASPTAPWARALWLARCRCGSRQASGHPKRVKGKHSSVWKVESWSIWCRLIHLFHCASFSPFPAMKMVPFLARVDGIQAMMMWLCWSSWALLRLQTNATMVIEPHKLGYNPYIYIYIYTLIYIYIFIFIFISLHHTTMVIYLLITWTALPSDKNNRFHHGLAPGFLRSRQKTMNSACPCRRPPSCLWWRHPEPAA